MTDTTVTEALRVKQWDKDYHKEYVRTNRFKRYMGTSANSIIQVKEDLTKSRGDAITIPLVGALDSTGGYNTGATQLVGSEKALPNEGHRVSVGVVRDATSVNVEEEQASAFQIRKASKEALMDLQMRYLRKDLIDAFGSKNGVNYGDATATQRNTWLTGNSDRVLFGDSASNNTGVHSTSLAAVVAGDTLSGDIVSLAKRRAQIATVANGDGIRPLKYSEDMEMYQGFCNSLQFRDLRAWLIANNYWSEARERSAKNPMFTGPNSIEWDGVMIREIPELPIISGAGDSGIDVAEFYICGSQALAAAWAKRTKITTRKETDYDFIYGCGFLELRGINKIQYAQGTASAVDWGMSTIYTASQADA